MPSSDFSLHGAVDLGARQAAAKKKQESPADAGSAYVVDVTDETFNTEVVERSRTVPVLVDFWAEWCGPCKQLGPILEKMANEAAGRWILAKVDVDANPQLGAYMQQMGVRGIPFVAVVVAGQLMPFLNGAAPEAQVRQGLDQIFEALKKEGFLPEDTDEPATAEDGTEQPRELDPVRVEADAALERGDMDAAMAGFQQMLDRSPEDGYAKQGLALAQLSKRLQGVDFKQALRAAAEQPGDAEAQIRAADVETLSGDIEKAFDRLVATVRRTAGDDRDKARKHMLDLFELLPSDDPRLTKGRRALQSALF
ncbi:MAG: tetratricopeptide repeat protein [Actinomadura sp.]